MNKLAFGAIDTNIWVYALNRQAEWHREALKFVKRLYEVGVVVTPQIVMETYNVITDALKTPQPLAAVRASRILGSLIEATQVTVALPLATTTQLALNLAKKNKMQGKQWIYDAFLAATLIDNEVEVLYTLNEGDFDGFGGLRVINPLG